MGMTPLNVWQKYLSVQSGCWSLCLFMLFSWRSSYSPVHLSYWSSRCMCLCPQYSFSTDSSHRACEFSSGIFVDDKVSHNISNNAWGLFSHSMLQVYPKISNIRYSFVFTIWQSIVLWYLKHLWSLLMCVICRNKDTTFWRKFAQPLWPSILLCNVSPNPIHSYVHNGHSLHSFSHKIPPNPELFSTFTS